MSDGLLLPDRPLPLALASAPASDGWGFVGRVLVADHECYRTLRAFVSPLDALDAAQALVGGALGTLLASQEWRALGEQLGRAPTRHDLQLVLRRANRAGQDGVGPSRR